jgi:hypothetical protein
VNDFRRIILREMRMRYKEITTVREKVLLAGLAVIAMFTLALQVGAQGPPPPGGFGRGGLGLGPGEPMAGSFEFEGLVGGFGGRTVTGHAFQAKFTITRTETLADKNIITNTTAGLLARSSDGNTYREVTLPGIGPWASSGKSQKFVYIRNVTKQMDYIVTDGTYEALAIPPQNARPGGNSNPGRQGQGPNPGGARNVTVQDNPSATYIDGKTTYSNVDYRITTRKIPAGQIGNLNDLIITTERWYSPALDLVMQITHNDPRFGTSIYKLTNIEVGSPTVSFLPDPSLRLVQRGRFGHDPQGPGKGPMPPSP